MSLLFALVLLVDPAFAGRADEEKPAVEAPDRRERRRVRRQPDEVLPPPVAPDAEDRAAESEPVEDGIFEWVESMEGEIPSEVQVEAVREVEAARHDEKEAERLQASTHPLFLDLVDPAEFDIPIAVTPEVEKWVTYFTGPGRVYYARWHDRSTRFRPMMVRELEAAGLPRDLVYLSMIESGYNPHAWSTAAAAGLWQFISSTARLYDLRVDYWVDDRRDPEASLRAAIAFLSELHGMFGHWELAWAAYNGGPGRVRRAVEGAGSNDFWVLARGTWLHTETDNYVPKIMAAAIIGHHPERYGFAATGTQPELVYETRPVEGGIPLDVIATATGLPLDDMKALNPALKRFVTPPEGYALRVPVGKGDAMLAALAALPPEQKIVRTERYKVRPGDTLSRIADRYDVTVADLMSANGLKSANRILVGTVLEVPTRGAASEAAPRPPEVASLGAPPAPEPAAARPVKAPAKPSAAPSRHTVRSGDTLSEVADRYGVSVAQLRDWNGLSSSTIRVGQSLRLTAPTEVSTRATSRHTVRRGETLSGIADRYDTSVQDLMRWNRISDASDIEAGRVLVVNGPSSTAATTVTVRSGDTLWSIATKHGVTVAQLQAWNGLKGTSIKAGQKLEIRR
jgi:membrane-bound lytic murein transglycosylase D